MSTQGYLMADKKTASFLKPASLGESGLLEVPPSALTARWFVFSVATIVVPVFVIRELFFIRVNNWLAILALVCWLGAGVFPEIEIDLVKRNVTRRLKFLRKLTVFSWKRQIPKTSRIQIHVKAYGNSEGGVSGYVHKIACVNGRKRITLGDFERSHKSQDEFVNGLAEKLAEALSLKYEGYQKSPGFFWS